MAFSNLGLSPELVRAVAELGYVVPTPIQAEAIPAVLGGHDVLGVAQTGTGKTASFTLPMIDILASGRGRARMPRSLILEPTRELAAQVAENFDEYGKYSKLSMALLIGGVSPLDQEKLLDRGVDVLIATPGRLLDHFERGRVLLNDVKVLVIDETDRMLDMGFIPDVEKIVGMLPKRRQTLFFSATMAPEIKRLADAFLDNPKLITVAPPASPAASVVQHLTIVPAGEKREALRRIIASEEVRNAIIFCNRKKDIGVLQKSLQNHGFNAQALHGDLAQSVRTETLDRFKKGEITYLIASDVAARGLDIADLSHVFNFDVPTNAEDYIHRIGRTGRAGKSGRAFMLATPDDTREIQAVETLIKMPVPRLVLDGIEASELNPDPGRGRTRRAPAKTARTARTDVVAAGEDKAGSNRTSEGGTSRKPAARKSAAAAPSAAPPSPPPAAPPSQPERRPARRRGNHPSEARENRRLHDDLEPPVTGFGDHIPAFLLRAPKIAPM